VSNYLSNINFYTVITNMSDISALRCNKGQQRYLDNQVFITGDMKDIFSIIIYILQV